MTFLGGWLAHINHKTRLTVGLMVDTVGWVNRRKLTTGEPHSIDIYTWKLPKTWVEYG